MPESVTPQPQATGTSSTESSTELSRLRTLLAKRSLLPEMLGWQSIRRTMEAEDSLAKRDGEAYHAALHGDRAGSAEDDDMGGHIVLGDMITNSAPVPPKKGMGTAGKLLVGASLLASGAGIGAAIPLALDMLNRPEVKAPVDTDTDTSIRLELESADKSE